MRARVALSVGGLLLVAGALNYVMVDAVAPGHGMRALMVDLSAAVAATILTVWLTARYESGIKRIAGGLAEVARGRRDLRFDVDREPLVANLALCANDAISMLVEPVDPAIGALRVRKRSQTGEVRVMGTDSAPARRVTPVPQQSGRITPLPPVAVEPAVTVPPASTPSMEPQMAPRVETVPPVRVETVPPVAAKDPEELPPMPPAAPETPSMSPAPARHDHDRTEPPTGHRNLSQPPILAPAAADASSIPAKGSPISDAAVRAEHFKTIFEEYRAALQRQGEHDEELTLHSFTDMLLATEKSLMDRHGCRAVRFSVLVQDSKVQLLPRLVR